MPRGAQRLGGGGGGAWVGLAPAQVLFPLVIKGLSFQWFPKATRGLWRLCFLLLLLLLLRLLPACRNCAVFEMCCSEAAALTPSSSRPHADGLRGSL